METNNQKNDQNIIPNDADKQQKGVNVPNLRFPNFNSALQKNKFGNLLTLLKNNTLSRAELNYENGKIKNIHYGDVLIKFNDFVLSDSKIIPYINDDSIPHNYADLLLKTGDLIIADTAEDYTVGKATELIFNDQSLIISGLHTIPCRPINNIFGSKYLGYYINSPSFHNQLLPLIQGIKVSSISKSQIVDTFISYPKIDEQCKITEFLTLIDQRIDTQSKIIEDLDTLKNSIMDQLLMRDIFDEISIKDFINQGYARIIKASEMKKFSGEKLYLSTSSIDKNGIFKIECKITFNDRPSRASMIPIKNSVWFAKMKDSIKVYKSENDDESKYILSTGFYGILCNEDVVNPDWMVEIFKSNYFNNQKDRFSEGSSMSGIKENQLEDIKVKLFKNKNLEKKYCQLFYILNKKLNVETDYLEKLKEQKKYLLLNMFI